MASKVAVLLDVDGVVCPTLDPSAPPPSCWPSWVAGGNTLAHLRAASGVLAFLRELDQTEAEVLWHTSWRGEAQTRLAPAFGLPSWELALKPEEVEDPSWWKLTAPARLLEEGYSLLWVDDDLSYSWRQGELERFRGGELLAISPQWDVGLTPAHLELMAEGVALLSTPGRVAFDPTRRLL